MENLNNFFQLGGALPDSDMILKLVKNFVLVVVILVGLLLICRFIANLSEKKLEFIDNCPPNQPTATQQIYNKYDEITKPSSNGKPNGYIGRDFVCFRGKDGDHTFMSKRTGCMACQVDSRQNSEKYEGTQTNVISTCVYSDDLDPNDQSVWTKDMCRSKCEKIKDL